MNKEEYGSAYPEPQGHAARAFEGFSEFTEESSAETFHRAVLAAAKAAADAAEPGSDPEWYELTRVRVLVGNPNVKVYGATITATSDPGR